ncbi:actin depolymerizing factor, putative [Perkinsus marinus ATCC 50983]|uniref:Actin depolymerizing factor, putative n=1 Tax=Perkinsus marinus (strain ATCC 50983 / TXsc) TaxID=423536 RepID=C5LEP6_PERM5|nr:actin depolymerizing factor, putative [Perkinsus marinus ATCC 50983]EER04796.1 actin depolymerizing factor, putative [Perkinsus marinus ATCC 50983]|eukprot:XP_002772980.1 actin depolymerizing factor, putative [Perkinsus marinus ATCC 50983]
MTIAVDDAALARYKSFKDNDDKRFIIFSISGDSVVVESEVGEDASYDDFISAIKESGEPRYAVVEVEGKIVFVSWFPENASSILKMKYASCKEGVVESFEGVQVKVNATDDMELSVEVLKDKVSR